jgi:hypothetical protein
MSTLYLHVGHGKTGSSWIQSVLRLSMMVQGIHQENSAALNTFNKIRMLK